MGKRTLKIAGRVVTIAAVVATIVCAVYIMAHQMGLVDSLDFGAGAYYYADIPDYQKYLRDGTYQAKLPYWVFVVLFLSWGWLMYKLWCWIDSKDKKQS